THRPDVERRRPVHRLRLGERARHAQSGLDRERACATVMRVDQPSAPYNPYAPPSASGQPAPPPAQVPIILLEPASRLRRIAAHLIEWTMVAGLAVLIATAYAVAVGPERQQEDAPWIVWAGMIPGALIELVLQVAIGQSLGKLLLGLRVVGPDGQAASLLRVVL